DDERRVAPVGRRGEHRVPDHLVVARYLADLLRRLAQSAHERLFTLVACAAAARPRAALVSELRALLEHHAGAVGEPNHEAHAGGPEVAPAHVPVAAPHEPVAAPPHCHTVTATPSFPFRSDRLLCQMHGTHPRVALR